MSAANGSIAGFPEAARISAATCPVRARSRPVMPTRAPRAARPIAVALPIPPVPPVTRTTLPDIGPASGMVCAIHGDHDGSSCVSFSDVTNCLGGSAQLERSVDDGSDLPVFNESLQDLVVLSVDEFDMGAQLALVEHRHCCRLHHGAHGAEPAPTGRSVVGLQPPCGGKHTPGVRQRMVRHVVEDEVVAPPVSGEVLARVVDDMVSADRADHLRVLRAADSGHLGAESLGDLYGERTDATGRAVDQDLLAGLDLALIAKQLESRRCRHADGRGLLKSEVGGLEQEM